MQRNVHHDKSHTNAGRETARPREIRYRDGAWRSKLQAAGLDARVARGAKAAGIEVQRFEVDKTGKIVVVTAQPAMDTSDKSDDEWDI